MLKPYIDIPRMAEIARGMVVDVLDAFMKREPSIAYDVIKRDDEVDKLTVQVFNELLFFMIQDPRTASRAVKITYITAVAAISFAGTGKKISLPTEWRQFIHVKSMVIPDKAMVCMDFIIFM